MKKTTSTKTGRTTKSTTRGKVNSTGFKGVRKTASGKYEARYYNNGTLISLGSYLTPQKASRVWNAYRRNVQG